MREGREVATARVARFIVRSRMIAGPSVVDGCRRECYEVEAFDHAACESFRAEVAVGMRDDCSS